MKFDKIVKQTLTESSKQQKRQAMKDNIAESYMDFVMDAIDDTKNGTLKRQKKKIAEMIVLNKDSDQLEGLLDIYINKIGQEIILDYVLPGDLSPDLLFDLGESLANALDKHPLWKVRRTHPNDPGFSTTYIKAV